MLYPIQTNFLSLSFIVPLLLVLPSTHNTSVLPYVDLFDPYYLLIQHAPPFSLIEQQRYAPKSDLPKQQGYLHTSLRSISTILSQEEQNRRIQQEIQRQIRRQRRNEPIMADENPPDPAVVDPAVAALLATNNTNNVQLNATLQALLNHFATPTAQIHDLFESPNAFNLSNRSGLTAYEQACSALDFKWDGGASQYPTFLIELQDRVRDCKWAAQSAK